MRLSIALMASMLLSGAAFAQDAATRAEAEALMRGYAEMFETGDAQNAEQVLDARFLKQLGGKEALRKKLGGLRKEAPKGPITVGIRPGLKRAAQKGKARQEETYFASYKHDGEKGVGLAHMQWFVLKRDGAGKLRVAGTIHLEGEK